MADADTLVDRLLPLLNSQFVTSEYAEEEVTANLYVKSDERLKMLQRLMAQFSEDYKDHLEKSQDVEWELIRQIHALKFTEASNKITFVKANCPIQEQRQVFKKITTALEFVKLAEKADKLNVLKSALKSPFKQPQFNKEHGIRGEKCKDLNLDVAMRHLEEATETIERYSHYLEEPMKKEMAQESHQLCGPLLTDADVDETCDIVSAISRTLGSAPLHDVPEYQLEPSSDIRKLHDILVANKEAIHNAGNNDLEVEIINPRTFLEEISKFSKNSKILNLKTKNS